IVIRSCIERETSEVAPDEVHEPDVCIALDVSLDRHKTAIRGEFGIIYVIPVRFASHSHGLPHAVEPDQLPPSSPTGAVRHAAIRENRKTTQEEGGVKAAGTRQC